MRLLTKSDLQKQIGKLNQDTAILIVNRGKPESVLLPYFEGNDELIDNYLEDYEIWKHKAQLQKELEESTASGLSDLEI